MRTGGAGSDEPKEGTKPDGAGVNWIQEHICKYVSRVPVMAIFVNSPKVI